MATLGLGSTSTLFEGRRPSPITRPPSGGEIKKLRERLVKYGKDTGTGLTEAACEFLAAAVTSPGAVRQQLSRPTIRPTASGHLEVIYATVPIDCLAPDPTNGRVVGATAWPASDIDEGQTLKLWAPADMTVHPQSACEALLTSDSLTSIKTVIEDAADTTMKLNPQMSDKVKQDGILDPLLCQLTHIETLDGERGIALVTRDGSTRCSFAKEAHRSSPHDAFFGSARDVDFRRQRWIEMRRRAERPMDSITDLELVEMRTFLVDVQIVVAFHSDDPRVSALDAVDDIVRRTHVEATYPWRPVAQSNSDADQMLSGLRSREVVSHDEFLLFGGTLPRSARAERKLPVEADCVVAELMLTLGAGAPSRPALDELHTKMRAVQGRGRISGRYKAALVGALGLRQFNVHALSLETAHLTLGEALGLDALWDEKWKNTGRSPEALRDAALKELRSGHEQPGPACRELVVKAAGHLAAQGWLKRESRAQGSRSQDPPEMVLDLMHRTEQGIYALGEALGAGRRNETARAVREDGEVIERAAGDVHPMTNVWLRQTFADATDREKPKLAGVSSAPTGPSTPRERVAQHMRAMEKLAAQLERELEDAARILDEDDGSFLDRRGWSAGEVEPLASQLQRTATKLTRYGLIADVNPGLPPVQQLDLVPAGAESA